MSKNIITVVVVVYNLEKYVISALESIVNQQIKGIEVIIVDDGSTDRTEEKIKEYILNKDFIKYIKIDNTGSAGKPRNVGIQLATGKYIMFLDGDDYIENNSLNRLCNLMNSQKLDMLVGNISNFNSKKRWVNNKFQKEIFLKDGLTRLKDRQGLLLNLGACNKIYNINFLINNNIYFSEDIRNGEDQIFTLKAYMLSKDIYIDSQSFYCYRRREEKDNKSATQITNKDTLQELIIAFNRNIKFLLEIQKEQLIIPLIESRIEYDIIRHINTLYKNNIKIEKDLLKEINTILKYVKIKDIFRLKISFKNKIKIFMLKSKQDKLLGLCYRVKN